MEAATNWKIVHCEEVATIGQKWHLLHFFVAPEQEAGPRGPLDIE